LSIITVSFNSEKTIERTINSVVSQKDDRVEYIIVDGGSFDDTVCLAEKYNQNIDLLLSEDDNGIYDAMNKGAKLARGKYISFLNSDDYYENGILVDVLEKLEVKTPSILYGDLLYVDGDGNVKRYWRTGQCAIEKMKRLWILPHPAIFMKMELYDEMGGFSERYKLASDYDLILRSLLSGCSVYYIKRVIVRMQLGGATNKSVKNILKGNAEIFSSYKSQFGKYPVYYLIYKILNRVKQYVVARSYYTNG